MPGDVIYTLLPHNNKLVMEENEREELKQHQLVTSSLIRNDKKVTLNPSRLEDNGREKGGGDAINSIKGLETLPLRTGILRARYEEKINLSKCEENRLTTTALVERPPPLLQKKEFELRRQQISTSFTDTPDSAGISAISECLNTISSESKKRPLYVGLPEIKKTNEKEENIELNNLEKENNLDVNELQNEIQTSDRKVPDGQVLNNKDEDESDNKEDDDCLVNCIYYTQQFCECSIL